MAIVSALRSGLGNIDRAPLLSPDVAICALESGAGQEGLDTSVLATVTVGSGILGRRRPRKRIVAPLSGDRVRPDDRSTVDHHTTAGPGPEDDTEDNARAGRRTVARLRQRQAICVVLESDGTVQGSRQILAQRPANQPGGIGVLHQSGCRRDGARHADAHSSSGTGGGVGGVDQTAGSYRSCRCNRPSAWPRVV